MYKLNQRNTLRLEITFVVLLVLTFGQVIWWIYDQIRYTENVNSSLLSQYEIEAELLESQNASEPLSILDFPYLTEVNGEIMISADALANIEAERSSRINRYFWEGSFFIMVISLCILIIFKTISKDRALNRRQQNFIASISHELKTPLTSMRLAAETIGINNHDERSIRMVNRILSEGDRLLHLIENLLDANKLDEKKFQVQVSQFAINSLIEKVLNGLSLRAEESGIEIQTAINADKAINNDPLIVSIILRNIIENGVKACEQSNQKLIRVVANRIVDGIEVEVIDSGIGIQKEEQENIFDKFYRVGDEKLRTTSGSGLGLYICRKLSKLTNISIEVSSKGINQGSTFKVLIRDIF